MAAANGAGASKVSGAREHDVLEGAGAGDAPLKLRGGERVALAPDGMRQLASYRARELPGLREAGEWLAANRPREWTPGIMHGDYHPANALVAPEPPARVAAILDWETATIGDPALDLGGFLRMWFEPGRSSGEVTREEMIATWERCSGRAAPDLRYYTTLSAFRLAVLLEGVYQRALQDPTRGPAEGMGDMVLELARFARDATRG